MVFARPTGSKIGSLARRRIRPAARAQQTSRGLGCPTLASFRRQTLQPHIRGVGRGPLLRAAEQFTTSCPATSCGGPCSRRRRAGWPGRGARSAGSEGLEGGGAEEETAAERFGERAAVGAKRRRRGSPVKAGISEESSTARYSRRPVQLRRAHPRRARPRAPAGVLPNSAEEDVKQRQIIENRARNISHNVRCTECGSQSIEDSQADVAILLRKLIRDEIKAGKSDKEIYKKLEDNYGETVLYAPKFDLQTAGIWLSPVIVGGIAAGIWAYQKHRQRTNVHIMALNLVRGVPLTPREKETMLDILTPPPPPRKWWWPGK